MIRAAAARFGRTAGIALAAVLALAALPFVVSDLGSPARQRQEHPLGGRPLRLAARRDRQGRRPRAKVKRCKVYTGNFQVQAVAWYLNMHAGQVGIDPKPPGIVIAPRYSAISRDPRFPLLAETRKWVVRRSCSA